MDVIAVVVWVFLVPLNVYFGTNRNASLATAVFGFMLFLIALGRI